ncbi:MAG: TonB-dependent receptor [Balneolaceae bacterium]|nr:MAG: TonB-dependent receptor [Balneolaceae bacterium]
MKNQLRLFLLIIAILTLPVTALAQSGTITGNISDELNRPLPGTTVQIQGTTLGTISTGNGSYILEEVPAGTAVLIVRHIGYRTARYTANLNTGDVLEINFTLTEDPLGLDEIIVSGTFNPATRLESSTAITTISSEQIEQRVPRGTGDLLKAVPGVQVTSNYGESGADVTVRGLPTIANSSFRYVSVQEDGLPVFEPPGVLFAFPDAFARHDETISRIEMVRGGSASVFSSNTPGGIVNLISKTGGPELAGTLKSTAGFHGLARQDFNIGGPLIENWRFNMGGYYRYDEGVRHPGFPANRGGQAKINLTRFYDAGYVRFFGKYVNERNVWFMGSPFQNYKNPEPIPGGPDLASGTTFSPERRVLTIPDAFNRGSLRQINMDNGFHVDYKMIGAELSNNIGNGWNLTVRSRYISSGNEMNLMADVADPFPIAAFAQPALPAQVPRFVRFVNSGQTVTNPAEVSNLNGNGLMTVHGLAFSVQETNNFITNTQISKQAGNHSLNAGIYYSNYRIGWNLVQAGLFLEVANQPRMIQVMVPTEDGIPMGLTPADGFAGYNTNYWNLRNYSNVLAFYFGDNWQVNDRINIDGGIRLDMKLTEGSAERPVNPGQLQNGAVVGQVLPAGYPDFVPTPEQSRAGHFGSGRYRTWDYTFTTVSGSLGINYKINDQVAIYARGSTGNRAPTIQQWTFQSTDGSQITGDTVKGEIETITQAEAGIKMQSARWSLLLTGYYSASNNLITNFHRGQPDGSFIFVPVIGDTRTIGAEIEAVTRVLRNLELRATATVQDPRFTKFEYDFFIPGNNEHSGQQFRDYSGNLLPEAARFLGDLTASYQLHSFNLFANYRYYGERMANRPNTIPVPAYSEVVAGAGFIFSQLSINLKAANLFNTKAITQMGARTGEDILRVNDDGTAEVLVTSGPQAGTTTTSFYTTGLGIMPRSILLSVAYNF